MHFFNQSTSIKQQATLWIERLEIGLSYEQKQLLIDWSKQSEQHQSALFNIASLWDDLSIKAELATLLPMSPTPSQPNEYLNRWVFIAISVVISLSVLSIISLNFIVL